MNCKMNAFQSCFTLLAVSTLSHILEEAESTAPLEVRTASGIFLCFCALCHLLRTKSLH